MEWGAVWQGHSCVPSNIVLNRGSVHQWKGEIFGVKPQSKFALQIAAKPLVQWLVYSLYDLYELSNALSNGTITRWSPNSYDFHFPPNNMFVAMPPSAKWLWPLFGCLLLGHRILLPSLVLIPYLVVKPCVWLVSYKSSLATSSRQRSCSYSTSKAGV